MPPTPIQHDRLQARASPTTTSFPGDWRANASREGLVVESWSEGVLVGSLMIMACITVANMRKGVLLHKLILAEQMLALTHGTFCFMDFTGYGYYLSTTAMFLYFSWIVHNVIAWMKIRPFYTEPNGIIDIQKGMYVKYIYLGTLALTVPLIIYQIHDNYEFYNNLPDAYIYTEIRPYEPLMRDPWWVFSCMTLFLVIQKGYEIPARIVITQSPRFGILLMSMVLSLIFTALDVTDSIVQFTGSTDGINPWWKLALVFKSLTDAILLDDFRTELQRLANRRIQRAETARGSVALVPSATEEQDINQISERRGRLSISVPSFVKPRRFRHAKSDSEHREMRVDSRENGVDPFEFQTSALERGERNGGVGPRDERTGRMSENDDDGDKDEEEDYGSAMSGRDGREKNDLQEIEEGKSSSDGETWPRLPPEIHHTRPD